jgi:ribosomal protein S18 acetylase RimI-like enzyme
MASGLRMILPRPRPRAAAEPAAQNSGRSYGIQYIAVDPACQGRGVGTQLLAASEEVARQRGYDEIHLSVYLDNTRAIRLYERMGWRRLAPDGSWQGLMAKRLVPGSG